MTPIEIYADTLAGVTDLTAQQIIGEFLVWESSDYDCFVAWLEEHGNNSQYPGSVTIVHNAALMDMYRALVGAL